MVAWLSCKRIHKYKKNTCLHFPYIPFNFLNLSLHIFHSHVHHFLSDQHSKHTMFSDRVKESRLFLFFSLLHGAGIWFYLDFTYLFQIQIIYCSAVFITHDSCLGCCHMKPVLRALLSWQTVFLFSSVPLKQVPGSCLKACHYFSTPILLISPDTVYSVLNKFWHSIFK